MARLKPAEAAVMQLWDDGRSLAQIACSTGISTARVRKIVTEYAEGDSSRRARAVMRRGSAQLLRAIQIAQGAS